MMRSRLRGEPGDDELGRNVGPEPICDVRGRPYSPQKLARLIREYRRVVLADRGVFLSESPEWYRRLPADQRAEIVRRAKQR